MFFCQFRLFMISLCDFSAIFSSDLSFFLFVLFFFFGLFGCLLCVLLFSLFLVNFLFVDLSVETNLLVLILLLRNFHLIVSALLVLYRKTNFLRWFPSKKVRKKKRNRKEKKPKKKSKWTERESSSFWNDANNFLKNFHLLISTLLGLFHKRNFLRWFPKRIKKNEKKRKQKKTKRRKEKMSFLQ